MKRPGTFIVVMILSSLFLSSAVSYAQTGKKKAKSPKKSISIVPQMGTFHPTFTMGPGSVGRYFYSQSEGSLWEMKIVERYYDGLNHIVASDSMMSLERVVSNSKKTIQGFPIIQCEALTWRGTDSAIAERSMDEYYIDDSLVMTVINHSITNADNHILLVTPLKMGGHWLEKTGDSARCAIVSMHDTVSTPYGNFGNALVTVTTLGQSELAKYFVEGVGLVKTVMRSPGRRTGDTDVVTSELIELVHGKDASTGTTSPNTGIAK